jgi:predicted XRE-type DNA-binding protein
MPTEDDARLLRTAPSSNRTASTSRSRKPGRCRARISRVCSGKLVSKIDDVIVKRGLSDATAGATMGLSGSKVSDLRNGRTRDYSWERLYELLNNLDGER